MLKKVPLGYDYKALEPVLSAATIYTHYNKHYLNYLNKLNELLEKYNVNMTREEILRNINSFMLNDQADILFNLGGVLNHELYFSIMSKDNNEPMGNLKEAMIKDFGGVDNFRQEFKNMASNLKGSGYTFLCLDPRNNRLVIVNAVNQNNPIIYGLIPLLNIDLWEHAYYLDYLNNKKAYIDNFMTIINYQEVNINYEKAINKS